MTTGVYHEISAFDDLGPEWDSLLDDSDQQNFFLRAEWNRLWWLHHAPPGARLYLITHRNQKGELVGIAPLYWRQFTVLGIPYFRELIFLGMGIPLKTSEYLDFIARRGYEQAVTSAFAHFLRPRNDWDRLWLWQVPRESPTLRDFTNALGLRSNITPCDRAPYIDTSISWKDYRASLGQSMRRNTEYYSRRLFKRYPCEFQLVDNPQDLDSATKALMDLHQARWQSQGAEGAFGYPPMVNFLCEAIQHSLPLGRLRLWTLKINGTTEAALVGFLDNGVLHYFQKGFNPAYAKDDIGTAMLSLCIHASFADPAIKAFDFMGGGAAYKEMWARSSRETLAYESCKRNTRATAFLLQRWVWNRCASLYRTLVPEKFRLIRSDWRRRKSLKKIRLHLSTLTISTWACELIQQTCLELARTTVML